MEDQISERQQNVVLQILSSLPRVTADSLRFSQVMSNLLTNACKYSPIGATITIASYEWSDSIQIDVADTGMGIPMANQPELFTKFFRVDNSSTREVSGTGLAGC